MPVPSPPHPLRCRTSTRVSDVRPRRWFWQDEYDGSVSPGWALTAVASLFVAVGLAVYWLNDMHMDGYGLRGR